MLKRLAIVTLFLALGTLAGCASHIVPLRPLQRVEVWVPDAPAQTSPAATPAAPATLAATTTTAAPATAASQPATEPAPGHLVVKMVDPNRTARFIYNAGYDNLWKQARELLAKTGFTLDRQDYRLGVLTTLALPSSQILEFWKPQQANANDALENTLNNQRRWITLSISTVEGKPDFFEIAIQVLVEREANPSENIGGPLFVEGSGFGRNAVTLQSDYAPPKAQAGFWNTVGHDPDLEKKLLNALFQRI